MNTQIKMRWCGFACYQIVLSDGTVILTDPCQYGMGEQWSAEPDYRRYADKTAADLLDRCDYVLLSHTHFDHVQDLPYVLDKFPDARVIVPDGGALPLVLKLNYSTLRRNIQIAGDKDRLCFPEFTLDCCRGKHTLFASTDPFFAHIQEQDYKTAFREADGSFDPIEAMFSASGGLDFRNYVISAPGGMRIFLWAGQILEDFRRFQYQGLKPDVMFVQIAGSNVGGDRTNPSGEIIGSFTMDVQPQVVLPIHQEKFTKANLLRVQEECSRYYQDRHSPIRYENPRAYEWFTITRDETGVHTEGC